MTQRGSWSSPKHAQALRSGTGPVFILGDSITVWATTALTAALTGRNVTIDAAVGRTLTEGLQVLASRRNDVAGATVVVALSTNYGGDQTTFAAGKEIKASRTRTTRRKSQPVSGRTSRRYTLLQSPWPLSVGLQEGTPTSRAKVLSRNRIERDKHRQIAHAGDLPRLTLTWRHQLDLRTSPHWEASVADPSPENQPPAPTLPPQPTPLQGTPEEQDPAQTQIHAAGSLSTRPATPDHLVDLGGAERTSIVQSTHRRILSIGAHILRLRRRPLCLLRSLSTSIQRAREVNIDPVPRPFRMDSKWWRTSTATGGGLPNASGMAADGHGTRVKASMWAGRTTRKSRWLMVATVSMSRRSATAMTEASTNPRSRSA